MFFCMFFWIFCLVLNVVCCWRIFWIFCLVIVFCFKRVLFCVGGDKWLIGRGCFFFFLESLKVLKYFILFGCFIGVKFFMCFLSRLVCVLFKLFIKLGVNIDLVFLFLFLVLLFEVLFVCEYVCFFLIKFCLFFGSLFFGIFWGFFGNFDEFCLGNFGMFVLGGFWKFWEILFMWNG